MCKGLHLSYYFCCKSFAFPLLIDRGKDTSCLVNPHRSVRALPSPYGNRPPIGGSPFRPWAIVM